MKIDIATGTKYEIYPTKQFNKSLKRIKRQKKRIDKLIQIITMLANGEKLDSKYRNHNLIDDNIYKKCRECHIEPGWLLIHRIEEEKLILILVDTGSHSKLFH